jgi:glycosyltransferase involved in cell wall biosynthesis
LSQNVLQLIGSFHQGGSEQQAVQLSRLLHENGRYRVHVATLNKEGPLRGEIERLGIGEVPEYRLTSFYDKNAVVQVRRFARFLREHEIDLVHTHDFYTNIFGMAAAALARLPARIASRRESAVRVAKQRLVERCAYRLANRVVANCDEVRQQVIKEGVPAKKVVTLYNGLDLNRLTPGSNLDRREVLAALGLPTDERRFVTIVANMRAHFWQPQPLCLKDHPTFLRAARRIREAFPGAAFVLAGEGDLLDQTRRLAAELGLEHDAFFIGRCSRVADLLAISDVCVLSSTAEGFSNSILEYMAASRPVVATTAGGAREAIIEGETGHLVSPGDDAHLAQSVISLLQHPDRARVMGARGRRLVEQKFSSEAQLERTSRLYESLLMSSASENARVVEKVSEERC